MLFWVFINKKLPFLGRGKKKGLLKLPSLPSYCRLDFALLVFLPVTSTFSAAEEIKMGHASKPSILRAEIRYYRSHAYRSVIHWSDFNSSKEGIGAEKKLSSTVDRLELKYFKSSKIHTAPPFYLSCSSERLQKRLFLHVLVF
jgi:hypothetical protein